MIYFEHTGRISETANRFRQFFITLLMGVEAIVLFPFTLLGMFLWGMWFLLTRPTQRLSWR